MFARRLELPHPLGPKLRTPAVVPSFSSKAFGSRNAKQALRHAYRTASEVIPKLGLVSAYDFGKRLLPRPSRLTALPEITILDSGGYEAAIDTDLSDVYRRLHAVQKWTLADYREVLAMWPGGAPAVLVSFDPPGRRLELQAQVIQATRLLAEHGDHMRTLLLKPGPHHGGFLHQMVEALTRDPTCLSDFNILGVTEKELGQSMSERMRNIALLRRATQDQTPEMPIHVFGALDPLAVFLYFVAGADIFDGLTWLRFAFVDGQCVYRLPHGIELVGLDARDVHIEARVAVDNVLYLKRMENAMREFVSTKDFAKFGRHEQFVRNACDSLKSELEW